MAVLPGGSAAGPMNRIEWPDKKRFAFTIFDDTDKTNLQNGLPFYDFLRDCGFRTTKSVWTVKGENRLPGAGSTCEDKPYLDWVLQLRDQGFEIGLHNVSSATSNRAQTEKGFETFRALFDRDPATLSNHAACGESIYWGAERLSGINRMLYTALMGKNHAENFRGHIQGDPLFWGDICRDRVTYVRNFVYNEINTLKACPFMPYHDPLRPCVKYWFPSTEGADVDSFTRMISEKNQDRLEAEGGACIMYTHAGNRFWNNTLDAGFKRLMTRLSKKNGWFVPVATLLDFLRENQGHHVISRGERTRLETKWLLHKIMLGGST